MILTEQLIYSFIAGGVLCVIAQLIIDLTKLTPARILVIFVSLGVVLFATGIYEPLFDIFGAGVSVPLTGFGANIASGVREAIDKNGAIGILTGGLTSSSAGVTVALIAGILLSLLFKTRSKKM